MADTATDRNRLRKLESGQYSNAWATPTNEDFGSDRLDEALDGVEGYTLSGSKTLTSVNYENDEARMRTQNITGGTGGTVTIPAVEKFYWFNNGSSGDVTVTNGTNSVIVKSGNRMGVTTDGTNVYLQRVIDYASEIPKTSGTPTAATELAPKGYVDGAIAAAELNSAGYTLATGMETFLGSATSASLASTMTDETGSGSLVFATSPTLVTPALGTPASGTLDNCTSATQSLGDNTTSLATTAFVQQEVAWTQLGTATPSTNSTAFTGISQSYRELLLVWDGISHDDTGSSRTLQFEVYDGSSWSSAVSISSSVAHTTANNGAIQIPRYTGEVGILKHSNMSQSTDPQISAAVTGTFYSWACAGGIDGVRLSWSGTTPLYDAGTVTLLAR